MSKHYLDEALAQIWPVADPDDFEQNKEAMSAFLCPGGVFDKEIGDQLFEILLSESSILTAMAYVVRCREVMKAMKRARKKYTLHELYLILSIDDEIRRVNK